MLPFPMSEAIPQTARPFEARGRAPLDLQVRCRAGRGQQRAIVDVVAKDASSARPSTRNIRRSRCACSRGALAEDLAWRTGSRRPSVSRRDPGHARRVPFGARQIRRPPRPDRRPLRRGAGGPGPGGRDGVHHPSIVDALDPAAEAAGQSRPQRHVKVRRREGLPRETKTLWGEVPDAVASGRARSPERRRDQRPEDRHLPRPVGESHPVRETRARRVSGCLLPDGGFGLQAARNPGSGSPRGRYLGRSPSSARRRTPRVTLLLCRPRSERLRRSGGRFATTRSPSIPRLRENKARATPPGAATRKSTAATLRLLEPLGILTCSCSYHVSEGGSSSGRGRRRVSGSIRPDHRGAAPRAPDHPDRLGHARDQVPGPRLIRRNRARLIVARTGVRTSHPPDAPLPGVIRPLLMPSSSSPPSPPSPPSHRHPSPPSSSPPRHPGSQIHSNSWVPSPHLSAATDAGVST